MKTTVLSIMPQCELFRGCSTRSHQLVADRLQFNSFTPGTTILQAGHSERALWIVLSGECRVIAITQGGGEIELAQLGPSSIFGEFVFLRTCSASSFCPCQKQMWQLLNYCVKTLTILPRIIWRLHTN